LSPAGPGAPDLGIALVWHQHPWEDLLALVRRAEALGYRTAWVDGDVSVMPSRGDGDVLDGWTLTAALLAATSRIEVGSIRLVHHWNAARLAQAVATLERIAPGRLRFLISIGGQPLDRSFGLPFPPAADRIAWLAETLAALRSLWAGETVTRSGRFVRLEGARVRPIPRGGRLPIEVAGSGARLLQVVAAQADRWDVNLPPVAGRVHDAARRLAEACRDRGRDPAEIGRSMWVFARPGADPDDPEVPRAYRRWNPWFGDLSPEELREAVVAGPPATCRKRLGAIRRELGVDLPVLDVSGLDRPATERVMEWMAGS
jgi:alkanesulfonate monooxygenase SsuD/methylene tetrahydromethanopterin reductase-like flavin-dependent oxidoreductase (luciferase family)